MKAIFQTFKGACCALALTLLSVAGLHAQRVSGLVTDAETNEPLPGATIGVQVAWQGRDTPLNGLDVVAALLMFGFIVVETVADQQQWNYQTEKHRRRRTDEPPGDEYGRGFCATGLWGRMRHPNYAAEQAIWLSYYLFSVAATGRWLNWSLAGAVLLMRLLLGSSNFSEKISAGKYPEYAEYQKRVPRFRPRWYGSYRRHEDRR